MTCKTIQPPEEKNPKVFPGRGRVYPKSVAFKRLLKKNVKELRKKRGQISTNVSCVSIMKKFISKLKTNNMEDQKHI